ncbi:MAG: hypothetical protein QXX94_00150 [Candidatus Bathyarchaeia archaeon]
MKTIIRYEREIDFSRGAAFPTKILLSREDTATASVRLTTLNVGDKLICMRILKVIK